MDPLEWDDSEENPFTLPDWATEDQVKALSEKIAESVKATGVYAIGPSIASGDPFEDVLHIYMNFEIGNLAFSKRVQDPEQSKVDTMFHQFETEATTDRIEDIKRKFIRGTDDPSS